MANNTYHHNTNPSFPMPELDSDPDDISVFLRQIFLPSSSSSSNLVSQKGNEMQYSSSLAHLMPKNQLGMANGESSSMLNSSSGSVFSSFSGAYSYNPTSGANVSSSSVGTMDNDPDEFECESEEGTDGMGVEAAAQPTPPRNPSKRSRAAEVHNLSEKRRRSRINEKMKALQKLIPNSNKTDKASMLDEAIEYLKQLQLQVQMLTSRNGSSLHPLGLQGALQQNQLSQLRMGFCEGNKFTNAKLAGALHVNQDDSLNANFGPADNCIASKQTPLSTMSNLNHSGNAYESESSFHARLDPFQLSRSTNGICREDWIPFHELNEQLLQTESIGASATSSVPFDTVSSEDTLEACMLGRYQLESVNESNINCNRFLAPPRSYGHV